MLFKLPLRRWYSPSTQADPENVESGIGLRFSNIRVEPIGIEGIRILVCLGVVKNAPMKMIR